MFIWRGLQAYTKVRFALRQHGKPGTQYGKTFPAACADENTRDFAIIHGVVIFGLEWALFLGHSVQFVK